MRALLPGRAGEVDVHAWYADGWVGPGGVRVNFVASVDGAVAASGRSGALQTPGDVQVFAVLRDLADVVVAGAGTVRAESYRPARISEERRSIRRAFGLPEVLPIAVVSRSLNLDLSSELFAGPPSPARTLVITAESAPADARRAVAEHAEVVDAGGDSVDPAAAVTALRERGLTRILCEGGPALFADVAGAGVLDELCLTLSPLLAGPGAGRITSGPEWAGAVPLTLRTLLEEDGALFARYTAPHPAG